MADQNKSKADLKADLNGPSINVLTQNESDNPASSGISCDIVVSGTAADSIDSSAVNGIKMLREVFDIADNNHIELCDTRKRTMSSGYRTSQFYKETDSTDRVVARYRVWTSSQSSNVTRIQTGFEKFSSKGELQDREVRYCEYSLH